MSQDRIHMSIHNSAFPVYFRYDYHLCELIRFGIWLAWKKYVMTN